MNSDEARNTSPSDDDLRALLRAADPAQDHRPLTHAQIDALITATTAGGGSPAEPTRPSRWVRRSAWSAAGLAAAAAAIAVVVSIPMATTTRVTELDIPTTGATGAPAAAMCAELTPHQLQRLTTAFEARVTSINDDRVVMDVTETFKGDIDGEVIVPQQAADLPIEFSPGRFEVGKLYLIGTTDGQHIATCGSSGPATTELRTLYTQAFTR